MPQTFTTGYAFATNEEVTAAKLRVLVEQAVPLPAAIPTTALAGVIPTAQLGEGAVTTSKLANDAVGTPKLAPLAVTDEKLAAGAVTGPKLGAAVVTADKLAAGAVTGDKIPDGAIPEVKMEHLPARQNLGNTPDGAVLARHIAAGVVTLTKLGSDVTSVLQSGLDPAKYQGVWYPTTNTPTILAAAGGNAQHWYFVAENGTATGAAAGTYAYGDTIISDGATAWARRPAPPTVIPEESITPTKLDAETRARMAGRTFSGTGLAGEIAIGGKRVVGFTRQGEADLTLNPEAIARLAPGIETILGPQVKRTFGASGVLLEFTAPAANGDLKIPFRITKNGAEIPGGYLNERGQPKEAVWGQRFQRRWRDFAFRRVRLAEAIVHSIGAIGDSWQWNGQNYLERLARIQKSIYGDGGPGYISFSPTTVGPASIGSFADTANGSAARTGTWTAPTAFNGRGPDLGETTSVTVGNKVTLACNVVCQEVVFLYLLKPGGGEFRYRWNGGAWSANVSTANGSDAIGSLSLVGVPATAPFTLEIEVAVASTGGVTMFGADCRRTGPGVRFHKLGHSGSRSDHWAAAPALWEAALAALGIGGVTVVLGTNDQGAQRSEDQFATNCTSIVDRLRTVSASMDVLLIAPYENLRPNALAITTYEAGAYRAAVARSCTLLSLPQILGNDPNFYDDGTAFEYVVAGDPIHPTLRGASFMCANVLPIYNSDQS